MTLEEGKRILAGEGLPFAQLHFENERAYWDETCPWTLTGRGRECPVTVLQVKAPNGKRHLELQFAEERLEDLYFGGFGFELWEAEDLERELLENIRLITGGQSWVCIRMDAKTKSWRGDGWFPREDGSDSMEKALEKLRRPRTWRERLFGTRQVYEVYDWNEYHRIER